VVSIAAHRGQQTAAGLLAAFSLGDDGKVRRLLTESGFGDVVIAVRQLERELPPLDEFVPRHLSATPMTAAFHSASNPIRQAAVKATAGRWMP
jgi:hypothetical protein